MVLAIFKRFFSDRFHDQSAQMAYFLMLAIFPFLIFLVSLFSYLPIYSGDVLEIIEPFAPQGSYTLLKQTLSGVLGQRQTKLISFSLIATFWIASMAVQALVRAMNDAYQIIRAEGFFTALLKDMLLTVILMITLGISLLVPIGEELARIFLLDYSPLQWWFLAKWTLSSIYLFVFFILLYIYVPSSKLHLRSALPGAIFATAGWQSVSVGYAYYVSFADYSQLYGQLGSIIVLMIWFYLTAAVLLIGALINAAYIEKHKQEKG